MNRRTFLSTTLLGIATTTPSVRTTSTATTTDPHSPTTSTHLIPDGLRPAGCAYRSNTTAVPVVDALSAADSLDTSAALVDCAHDGGSDAPPTHVIGAVAMPVTDLPSTTNTTSSLIRMMRAYAAEYDAETSARWTAQAEFTPTTDRFDARVTMVDDDDGQLVLFDDWLRVAWSDSVLWAVLVGASGGLETPLDPARDIDRYAGVVERRAAVAVDQTDS